MWQGENLKVALMSRCFDLLHRAVLGSFNRLPLLCLSKHPSPPFPKLHPPKIILVMGTLLTMALLSPFKFTPFPPFHTLLSFLSNTLDICLFSASHPSPISRGLFTKLSVVFSQTFPKIFPHRIFYIFHRFSLLLTPHFSPECVQPCGARMQERSRWSSHFPQQVDDLPQDQAQLLRPWQLPLLLRRSPVHEQHRGHQGGRHGLWDLQHA